MGLAALKHVRSSLIRDGTHVLLHWQADSLPLSHQGSPHCSLDLHFSVSDVEHLFMCMLVDNFFIIGKNKSDSILDVSFTLTTILYCLYCKLKKQRHYFAD